MSSVEALGLACGRCMQHPRIMAACDCELEVFLFLLLRLSSLPLSSSSIAPPSLSLAASPSMPVTCLPAATASSSLLLSPPARRNRVRLVDICRELKKKTKKENSQLQALPTFSALGIPLSA